VELQGDIQSWPFDSYVTTVVAQACTDADGQSELPTEFAIDGDVQGWHLAITPASEQPGLYPTSACTGLSASPSDCCCWPC